MLHPHHEDRADDGREEHRRHHDIADVTGDRAKQRDYKEVASPGTRRTFGLWLTRAADEEADREREQKSESGRIRGGRLGHRDCDVIAMLAEMLAGQ